MSRLARRLHVVIGKGGVGKTTVSAALGLQLSRAGRRVLVAEVRVQQIPRLLGAEGRGYEIVRIADRLEAISLDPKEAMREYALMRLHSKLLVRSLLENRVVTAFLGFIPSLPELVMLGKLLHCVRTGEWDTVIFDAPATGHGLTFLGVPQALRDAVPPGALRSEADWMQEILVDSTATAVELVTLPEELAVNETLELAEKAGQGLGLPLGRVLLNRHVPLRFSDEELKRLEVGIASEKLAAASRAAREHEIRARRSRHFEERLRSSLALPLVTLPMLHPERAFGRAEIEALAERIEAAS